MGGDEAAELCGKTMNFDKQEIKPWKMDMQAGSFAWTMQEAGDAPSTLPNKDADGNSGGFYMAMNAGNPKKTNTRAVLASRTFGQSYHPLEEARLTGHHLDAKQHVYWP